VADFGGWVGGGFPNDLIQRDAQREHLAHHVGQVDTMLEVVFPPGDGR